MVVSALLSAILYGAGAALEQRQAAAAPDAAAGRPRLLVLLVRQPLWLLGIAAQFGGFATHAVALRSGPLAIVQMLVAAELIVSVVLVRIWSGRRLSRSSWSAALTVVAGIAAFLVLTSSSGDDGGQAHDVPHRALVAVAALGITATALGAAGLGAAGRRRAILLAVAAGLADAAMAVVTMAFSHVASHGPVAVATSWTAYAVVVCGIGNVLLTQTAYQAGQPMITLPIISAVTPAASVAIGAGILGEAHRIGVAAGATAAIAVLVTSLALASLARSVPSAPVGPVSQEPVDAFARIPVRNSC
jgi:drug/metabolite transporter (DMT)-like permease